MALRPRLTTGLPYSFSEAVPAGQGVRSVVEQYQSTTHVPEALMRLTETYLALGVPQEAQRSAAVLGANYPTTQWYRRAYELMESYPRTRPLGRPGQQAEAPAEGDVGTAPPPATEAINASPQVTSPAEPPAQPQPAPGGPVTPGN